MRRPPAAAPATLASAPAPAAADVSEKPDPNARSASLDSLPPAALSLEELVSKVMPAVVRIETAAGSGSGFFVKPDTILTNVHVVSTNLRVTVRLADGDTLDGRVERTASEYDIAVVRVDSFRSNQVTIPLGSGAHARPGQEVVAVGSPLGLQNTVTRGIVSAIRKSGGVTLVQTDAALNPGNSGGPLLDRSGEAIGISTLSYRAAQGLSFAVAIDHAIDVVSGRIPSTPVTTPAFESMASTPPQPAPAPAPTPGTAARTAAVDRVREDGSRAFEKTMTDLARRANELDASWPRFKSVCYGGPIVGSFDREWFALLDPRAMPGPMGCRSSYDDLQRRAEEIRRGVVAADEAARQADVYPGVRRDVRQRLRLDLVR
jgi:S1-C subfamily serine protease